MRIFKQVAEFIAAIPVFLIVLVFALMPFSLAAVGVFSLVMAFIGGFKLGTLLLGLLCCVISIPTMYYVLEGIQMEAQHWAEKRAAKKAASKS